MRYVFIFWLCWAADIPSQAAAKSVEPPLLLTKVEPDTTGLTSDVLIDLTHVNMTVDSDGEPFALESSDGLPDRVVTALAQWRFKPGTKDGRRAAFAISFTVPVRQELTARLERSLALTWSASGLFTEILDLSNQWDPKEIKKRAGRLSSAMEREEMIHGTALLHALFTGTPEQVHEARVDHLLWMIQNAPQLEILGTPAAVIGREQEPFADSALKEQVAKQWLKQIAAFPNDFEVLDHALNFLQFADPRKAAALTSASKGWSKSGLWIGHEYGLRGVGVTGLDPRSGAPIIHEDQLPNTPFELGARSALLNSKNTKVVLSGLAAVSATKHFLQPAGHMPLGYDEFCGELLQHAKELYAKTSLSCDPKGLNVQENAYSSTNRGVVVGAKLKKKVAPVYPPEAKQRGIRGTVTLSAFIDRQGNLENILFLSGPLALYVSARDAVRQWGFAPTTINGDPVEVQTTLTVNYTLP